jgi:hypothetical protein
MGVLFFGEKLNSHFSIQCNAGGGKSWNFLASNPDLAEARLRQPSQKKKKLPV